MFKTRLSETRKHNADLTEYAVAHTEKDKTKAAYNRTDMPEQRCPLTKLWATFCGKGDGHAKVMSIR